MAAGMLGTSLSILVAAVVLGAWSAGWITVQGYTPLILAISFFGGLTTLGLGIVGQYLWLALRNTRQRPNYIIRTVERFEGAADR
jgi:hypothetical protein